MIRNKIENTSITSIWKEEEDATTNVTLAFFLKNTRKNYEPMYLNMLIDYLNSTTQQN